MKPTTVAFLRSLGLGALAAAVPAVVSIVQGDTSALSHTWWFPLLLIGLRNAEGVVDELRGQATQKPGGSGPANPAAYIAHSGVPVGDDLDALREALTKLGVIPAGTIPNATFAAGGQVSMPGTFTSNIPRPSTDSGPQGVAALEGTEIPVTHVADEMGPEGTIGADGVLQAVPVEVPVDTEPHAS